MEYKEETSEGEGEKKRRRKRMTKEEEKNFLRANRRTGPRKVIQEVLKRYR